MILYTHIFTHIFYLKKGYDFLKKKLLSIFLCAVVVLASAFPAYAEYQSYDIVRDSNDSIGYNMCLSLYSTRGAYNNCRLSSWDWEGSSDQKWEYKYDSNLGGYIMTVHTNPTYALNAYLAKKSDQNGSYYQADVYPYMQNPDALLHHLPASCINTVTNYGCYIKNVTTGYYLTVSGRLTASQPSDKLSVSYYVDWYQSTDSIRSIWRYASF